MDSIKSGILSVGASDPQRRLFDALIPLPEGTSYNAYLIKGDNGTALIDTVDPTKTDILLTALRRSGAESIDYVIANHAEQDHSGSLPAVLQLYPKATVICSGKCKPMLIDLLHLAPERIRTVKDGETISLGNRTLEFVSTPWVHWPETMTTYLREQRILFSCDLFGSHKAADDLLAYEEQDIQDATRRYYAEIMMPFRPAVVKNVERLSGLKPDLIAPSHGPIHKRPDVVMDWYRSWTSDVVENLAVIAYVSMHGSTQQMATRLASSLEGNGVRANVYDLVGADLGDIASDLVDAATLVVGTPCVLSGIHPVAMHAIYTVNSLRPKTKFVGLIASYGWGQRIAEQVVPMLDNLKVEFLPPVMERGLPTDYSALDGLAKTIAAKHQSLLFKEF
jgi:flavorubredoxin